MKKIFTNLLITTLLVAFCTGCMVNEVSVPTHQTIAIVTDETESHSTTPPTEATVDPSDSVFIEPDVTESTHKESETTTTSTEPEPNEVPATDPVHEHSYYIKSQKAASCITNGVTIYACSCGESYETANKARGYHSWSAWKICTAPTVSTEGKEVRSCKDCGATDEKRIDKLPAIDPPPPDTEMFQWYTLGDSITQGFNSEFNADGVGVIGLNEKKCWAKLAADQNGWELTNYGVGGSGFVHDGTVLDKLNARDHVDTIDFSDADLVTIAYGVNDWKYNMPLGSMDDDISTGGTIYSNMRYLIEKIQSDSPDAKIVVISPMNCSLYGNTENGWGLGYSFPNSGTLEDIFHAEQEVCEYYDLPYIDMLHNSSSVTVENAPNVLPDGIHPSLECHAALALELTQKIAAAIEQFTNP